MTKIIPQRKNANRHTARGMGMLEASIQQDGIIGAMTVAADGETFDGSARGEVLPAVGFDLNDVSQVVKAEPGRVLIIESDGSSPLVHRRVDIPSADDPKAQRLGVAANRVAQVNLDWEPGVLASVNDEAGLGALFFPDELKDLAQPSIPEPGGGGDDFDATPDDGPTRAQLGDLWIIGGVHRLLVGDCTDAANVARLMGGERLRMVWTDPPYGVNHSGGSKDPRSATYRKGDKLQNDNLTEDQTEELVFLALSNAAQHGTAGASAYVAAPPGPLHRRFIDAMDRSGFGYRHGLVWVKDTFVFGRSDYHYRHEPILYGWLEGAHYFIDDRTQSSVFEVSRPKDSDDHPTMKPVELVQRMVSNSAPPNDLVYDPFLGSGTTLIAAHRTGRRCYGCELSPRYADVILRRAEAEGLTVERVESPHEAAVTP